MSQSMHDKRARVKRVLFVSLLTSLMLAGSAMLPCVLPGAALQAAVWSGDPEGTEAPLQPNDPFPEDPGDEWVPVDPPDENVPPPSVEEPGAPVTDPPATDPPVTAAPTQPTDAPEPPVSQPTNLPIVTNPGNNQGDNGNVVPPGPVTEAATVRDEAVDLLLNLGGDGPRPFFAPAPTAMPDAPAYYRLAAATVGAVEKVPVYELDAELPFFARTVLYLGNEAGDFAYYAYDAVTETVLPWTPPALYREGDRLYILFSMMPELSLPFDYYLVNARLGSDNPRVMQFVLPIGESVDGNGAGRELAAFMAPEDLFAENAPESRALDLYRENPMPFVLAAEVYNGDLADAPQEAALYSMAALGADYFAARPRLYAFRATNEDLLNLESLSVLPDEALAALSTTEEVLGIAPEAIDHTGFFASVNEAYAAALAVPGGPTNDPSGDATDGEVQSVATTLAGSGETATQPASSVGDEQNPTTNPAASSDVTAAPTTAPTTAPSTAVTDAVTDGTTPVVQQTSVAASATNPETSVTEGETTVSKPKPRVALLEVAPPEDKDSLDPARRMSARSGLPYLMWIILMILLALLILMIVAALIVSARRRAARDATRAARRRNGFGAGYAAGEENPYLDEDEYESYDEYDDRD